MNNTVNKSVRLALRLGLLCLIAPSFHSNDARAGLSLTIDLYRTSQGQTFVFYTPLATNALAPTAATGTYVIRSPGWPASGSRRGFEMTASGLIDRTEFDNENSYGDFNSAMQQITNGTWSILFTNATTTNLYTFTVSAPTINSNLIPATVITFPSNDALNIPNQPAFAWQGPTSWPVNGSPYVANYDFSFYQPASIPAAQTSWTIPTPIPNDMNCTFMLNYVTNYATSVFVAATPLSTNTGHAAISGWASATTLETGDGVSFAVTNPPSAGITLVAHYTFDNSGNLGQDTSGHGYDLNYNGGNGVTSSGTAEAGSGAASFDGNSFFGYNSTPSTLLSTLAGDFTISFWIKTTQNDGNEGGVGWQGTGLVSADVPGQRYDLIPAALDGGEIGFNTGPYDDTLNTIGDVNNGNYHHVAVTRNQATGEKRIYIDGTLNNYQFATLNPLSDPRSLAIGCKIDASQANPANLNPSQYFQGLLDDIQVYAGVLSPSAVAQLYANSGSTAVPQDFNLALNTSNLTWTTTGDTSWFVETTNTHDGFLAAKSGIVTNDQSSTLSLTVTGPGTLTFYWASQDDCQNFDYVFDIDGNNTDDISCSASWGQDGPFDIPAGQHTLNWTAYSNGDTDPTQAGFLDQVSYVQDTAPVITLNPFNQTNYPGYNVALLAAATNSANTAITWQWFKVGNASPIPNATSALFIPTNSGTAGVAGNYYAVASTPGGSATSTTASVSFRERAAPARLVACLEIPLCGGGFVCL